MMCSYKEKGIIAAVSNVIYFNMCITSYYFNISICTYNKFKTIILSI